MFTGTPEIDGFAFTACPLDRSDVLRDRPDDMAALWPAARLLVLDAAGDALCGEEGLPLALTGADLGGGGPGTAIFLGIEPGGAAWFCVDAATVSAAAPRRIGLRQAGALWPAALAGIFAYARGMSWWQARTRHCGVCGGAVEFHRGGFVGQCTQCGSLYFPRIDPAVIVAATDGARLLLGRKPDWPERRYSLIAGFMEPGEMPEQTVAREVMEETGVRIRHCRYLAAQPWPFPGALMLGFEAQAEPDAPRVTGELEHARWATLADIGEALARGDGDQDAPLRLPPALSIARALIVHWYRAHGGHWVPSSDRLTVPA